MKLFNFIVILLFCPYLLLSQGSAGESAVMESRYIVDMPTAGIVPYSSFAISMEHFENGGVLIDAVAAPFENFNMGLSYGAAGIIGSGEIEWQSMPGIFLAYRVFDERPSIPAFTLGVNTQGIGTFNSDLERFATFSPGIYLAASKNFNWKLGDIAFHSGVNYSFEPEMDDRSPNLFFGFEQSLGDPASINLEYNFNLDDKNKDYMKNQGLLNAAIRFSVDYGMTIELQFRDLLNNYKGSNESIRYFRFEYIKSF